MDESFVAKLLDVGSELELEAGDVLVDPERPGPSLYLIRHGTLLVRTRTSEDERGPGQVIGTLEELDGPDGVTVTALTEARVVAVERADYEAALYG